MLIATLWLLVRPYIGLRHDGLLYLAQVLHRLSPEFLASDIFFAHGSQDSFSLFSRVLAPLYKHLSVEHAQWLVLAPSSIASLCAVYRLLACLPSANARWLGLACFVVMSSGYGGGNIFSFGEDFVTARTVAEPLSLWALAWFVEGRHITAIASLVAAALFHPLMALPAFVLLWIALCQADLRWLWLILLTLPPLALAVAGIAPFDGLLRRYDDEWWRLVKEVNGQVLLQEWNWADWQSVIVDGALLLAARFCLPRPLALVYSACLFAALLLLGVTAVGADLGRDLLITQLQLWRVLWLVHVLALCGLPYLLLMLVRRGQSGWLAAVACLAAVFTADIGWPAGWPLLVWAGLSLWICLRKIAISARTGWVAIGASLLCIAVLSSYVVYVRSSNWEPGLSGSTVATPLWLLIVATPALALGAATAALWAFGQPARMSRVAVVLTVLMLLAAAAHWDRRSDWTRFAEKNVNREHPFTRFIPPDAQVLWQDNLVASWVLLRRSSYFAKAQGAGLLFNEGTAREFGPRWDAFEQSREEAKGCRFVFAAKGDREEFEECLAPPMSRVAAWCRKDSKLGFVVLTQKLSVPPLARWDFPIQQREDASFFLYSCGQLA